MTAEIYMPSDASRTMTTSLAATATLLLLAKPIVIASVLLTPPKTAAVNTATHRPCVTFTRYCPWTCVSLTT
jgi:hypothetical protein